MHNNPTAIVMGATSGIGYEVARLLALRGWKVGVAGRREDILSKMTTGIEGVVAYELIDVTTPQAIEGRKSVITINWLYRLLVFFWQMIPRCAWIRMRVN